MAKPIHDDELRGYSEWGDGPATDMITGDVCRDPDTLQRILVHVRLTARDLARELLALRAAARAVCADEDLWGHGHVNVMREMLPSEPRSVEVDESAPFAEEAKAAVRDALAARTRALLPEEPK